MLDTMLYQRRWGMIIHRTTAEPDGRLDAAATYDGLHLNAEGYRRVTEALLPRLLEACGVAQPTVQ